MFLRRKQRIPTEDISFCANSSEKQRVTSVFAQKVAKTTGELRFLCENVQTLNCAALRGAPAAPCNTREAPRGTARKHMENMFLHEKLRKHKKRGFAQKAANTCGKQIFLRKQLRKTTDNTRCCAQGCESHWKTYASGFCTKTYKACESKDERSCS